MFTQAPTEKSNTVNEKNLPLLKEEDELVFSIVDKSDYGDVYEFLKSKVITRPTVIFNIEAYESDEKREFLI